MSYWGSRPVDNDYAFGAVGVYVFLIKERMFKDMRTVIQKSHPEQGLVASVQCLRLLATEFPKNVQVHFGRKDLDEAKLAFRQWYELVEDKVPSEYREAIRQEAEAEFDLFEEQVLAVC